MRSARRMLAVAACALALGVPAAPAAADPPPWAPAHGYRKKQSAGYVGVTGQKWPDDYGVLSGKCNRDKIGAAIGGVVGGAIGSQVAEGDARAVAVLVGAAIGAFIGREIGRELDKADRACIGQTLELAPDQHRVSWTGGGDVAYSVTPQKGYKRDGRTCRDYLIKAGGDAKAARETACRNPDGNWTVTK